MGDQGGMCNTFNTKDKNKHSLWLLHFGTEEVWHRGANMEIVVHFGFICMWTFFYLSVNFEKD